MGMTFLFVPGAWTGAWIWQALKQKLEKQNHKVYTITLSGLNSESENRDFGLQDHVDDVKKLIQQHSLTDLILVGHSYSGFVIGQVADQIPDKISRLIFIEAFLPTAGKNLLQAAELDPEEETRAIKENDGKWPPPTLESLRQQPHLATEQVKYLNNNFVDHPAKSVTDKATIKSNKLDIPSVFIGEELSLSDEQKSVYGKVEFRELNGGHWTMLTELEKLTKILNEIATA